MIVRLQNNIQVDQEKHLYLLQDREILQAVSSQKKPVCEIERTLVCTITRSTVNRNCIQESKIYKYRRIYDIYAMPWLFQLSASSMIKTN